MSEPLQYGCDEHGYQGFKPCPTCYPASSFATSASAPDERLEFLRTGSTETLIELLKEIVTPMELGCSFNFFLLAMDRRFRTTRPEELFDLIAVVLRERVPSEPPR